MGELHMNTYLLEKELNKLKNYKLKIEQVLTNIFLEMVGIFTIFCISIVAKYFLSFIGESLYEVNFFNTFLNIAIIGSFGLEMLLGFKAKKIVDKRYTVDSEIHKKDIELTEQREREMELALKIVDKIVNRNNKSQSYHDDYSNILYSSSISTKSINQSNTDDKNIEQTDKTEISSGLILRKQFKNKGHNLL